MGEGCARREEGREKDVGRRRKGEGQYEHGDREGCARGKREGRKMLGKGGEEEEGVGEEGYTREGKREGRKMLREGEREKERKKMEENEVRDGKREWIRMLGEGEKDKERNRELNIDPESRKKG